jgi:AraC-like DNA-binding protein
MVEIVEFSSTDPDVAHEEFRRIYAPERPPRFSGAHEEFDAQVRLATAGPVGADRMHYSGSVECEMAPPPIFYGNVGLGGAARLRAGREEFELLPGTVAAFPFGRAVHGQWSDIHAAMLRVPMETVELLAAEHLGLRADRLRFFGMAPVSTAMATQWRQLTGFVHQQMGDHTNALMHPLVEVQLGELVAATALAVFPNNATDQPYRPPPGHVGASTTRRAMEFIDAHAADPITVVDVARAVGVTARALQAGFRRHQDTTPSEYLRRARLDGAHRQLAATDPATGATVAAIAAAWGFGPSARFAQFYRQRYGRPPSHTLREQDPP